MIEDAVYKDQEASSSSVKNVNESSLIQANEMTKRNFYLQLF